MTNEHPTLEPAAYLRSIVDTVREPLLVLDGSLRVTTASHAFYETFGVSPSETIGRFVYDLGNGQWDIPALRTLLEELLPDRKALVGFEVAHEFPTIGNKVMLLNARCLWQDDTRSEHVLLAIEDVTERKRVTDELVLSNESLQRFAYVAAHDLRSPLNSALTLLQLLDRRASPTMQEENVQTLQVAMSNLGRLRDLMEDLLTYSAAEYAPQRRTTISLHEPLKIALANLEHHISVAGATVTSEPLPAVGTDRTQMVMVFQNLIGNAIKYHGTGPPTIRIGVAQHDGCWQIDVADNGQGFPQDQAEKIFEPFRRLHGKDIPGSGIGLATCKRVIERLGGNIWATASPGKGATFSFTIPILD
jgi:two-component system phosphate regulon sensor histidine kinase PhoR